MQSNHPLTLDPVRLSNRDRLDYRVTRGIYPSEIDDKLDEDLNQGLKPTSENPLFSGLSTSSPQSVNGDGDPRQRQTPCSTTVSLIAQTLPEETPHHSDLQTLFSDVQPFGLLDTSPTTKKSSDRDDLTERAEDLDYTVKTQPMALSGPFQPAKNFNETTFQAVTPDMDGSDRSPEDVSNDLFEGMLSNAFSSPALQFHALPLEEKEARRRGTDDLWTASDDAVLKQLVDRYSTNWALVTECFNSSRIATPTERRTPADCAERWKEKWSAEREFQPGDSVLPVGEDGSTQNRMTTRAVKGVASANVSDAQGAGEKNRRRHYLLQESIKRAVNKRADVINTMENRRKPAMVHETHIEYNRLPSLTPLELARMKAEKDEQERRAIQLARRAMSQNLFRESQVKQEQTQLAQQAFVQQSGGMPGLDAVTS